MRWRIIKCGDDSWFALTRNQISLNKWRIAVTKVHMRSRSHKYWEKDEILTAIIWFEVKLTLILLRFATNKVVTNSHFPPLPNDRTLSWANSLRTKVLPGHLAGQTPSTFGSSSAPRKTSWTDLVSPNHPILISDFRSRQRLKAFGVAVQSDWDLRSQSLWTHG